ncbi:MerR family transcriptional regulator [Streptomyces rimosus]|uniref:helix-turn-helix domain-containing protein n=1 Tax=Streptomyces rimosus TaxID=1927 RepID=UPI0004CA524E|nr:MerR family transcriptional regulator [Streptomyces rimosus]
MNGDTSIPIGELARRTGLTVKAIRFYSDSGIVTPAGRSPGGYRLYDNGAVARLALIRTLRALGLDLPTVRQILDQEVSLPRVAATHAEALGVQIQTLRLQRSLLIAAAERGSTPEELDLMHQLATLSEDERRRLTGEFLDTVFDGLDTHPAFTAVMSSLTPELPDDPSMAQIQAWVELAGLFRDADFRASMRGMAQDLATDRAPDGTTGLPRVLAEAVRCLVEPALAAGIDPRTHRAEPVISALAAHYAHIVGRADDPGLRRRLATHLESMDDPRRDRYLQLLAVLNGRPAPESLAPALDWSVRALRAHTPSAAG